MTWVRQPLKHLADVSVSNVDKKSVEGAIPVRLVNYTDVYYGDRLGPNLDLMNSTATARQVQTFRLFPGDVVITKDSETADDIGIAAYVEASADDMVLGYHLALLRPRSHSIHGRFLYWSMCSDHARGQLSSSATGVTRFGLRRDAIGSVELRVPELAEQQAIADYLDIETARIDALVAKKRQTMDSINERCDAVVESTIRQLVDQYGSRPLKYLARRIEVGIVVTPAVWYAESGVVALRGLNIRRGTIDLADHVWITEEGHQLHRKSQLRQGDVVVVRTGQAGAAAVVPPELAGANCIDLVIVRPGPKLVPEFLEIVLNSDWTKKHIEKHSVGTIQSHFNVGAMKQVSVAELPLRHQRRVVASLSSQREWARRVSTRLVRQIALLREHRQALITAAVTNEIDVPGAAA